MTMINSQHDGVTKGQSRESIHSDRQIGSNEALIQLVLNRIHSIFK